MTEITPNLFLGNSADARDIGIIKSNKITGILNVAHDLANALGHDDGLFITTVGLRDGPGNSLIMYHAATLCLYSMIHHEKLKTLVHCHEGKSRSAAIVIMYLHLLERRGWDWGLAKLKEKRPIVEPHEAHWKAFNCMNWHFLKSMK